MRLLPALLILALTGCDTAGGDVYPPLLPLTPLLAETGNEAAPGDPALEARAAALRSRAAALQRAAF